MDAQTLADLKKMDELLYRVWIEYNNIQSATRTAIANIEAAHRFDDGLAHLNITLKALAVGMFSDPMGPFGWLVAARPEVEKTTKAIIDMAISHGQASAATTEHITKADILIAQAAI